MQFVYFWLAGEKHINLRTSLPSKETLRLVQSSFSPEYLMNAMFGEAWAVEVVM
jgi:hypothetical protein